MKPIVFGHTQGLDVQASTVASPTIRANGNGLAVLVFAPGAMIRMVGMFWEGIMPTLRAESHGGNNVPMIEETMIVRRLTPVECERLMGWPDNHTLHRADGRTNADSTRYKMCGNGVASPVAEWIGRQILAWEGSETAL